MNAMMIQRVIASPQGVAISSRPWYAGDCRGASRLAMTVLGFTP